MARVPPLVGRSLVEGDEQAGAPAVVVIGYDVWQNRFEGDPEVVGRTVRLGSAQPTVVGVMPEGFEFPIFHNVWVPLRLNVLDHDRLQGPGIYVFGRLAPGATLDQAQAELNTLGRRAAAEFPDTHEYLSPQVMPYAQSVLRIPPRVWRAFSAGLLSSNLAPTMLLLLICANVALLIFARAASRESELVVRNALGASRARIVGQLFVEALVLGGVAAIIGLAAAAIGLRWGLTFVESVVLEGQPLPFWFDASLSSASILYAGLFTVLGAVVAGVVPGLKVTGGIGARLKEATAGGGGLQFGGVWTAVIVTQVALTVAFPAVALIMQSNRVRIESVDFEIPAEEYLTGRLEMDREALSTASVDTSRAAFLARYGTTLEELERRLASDAAVTGVTFADLLPRMYHPWNQIEMEEGAVEPPDARGHRVGRASVALNYFEEFDAPIISGRGFNSSDLSPDERVVIVNNTFVRRVLGGRNPIGQRVRHVADESSRVPSFDGPWYEIVGVVRDLGTTSGYGESGIYHPVALADTYPLHVALHVRGEPESFAPQLRTAASELDATLRLHDLMPLNEAVRDDVNFYDFWFRLTTFVSSITLFLSLAGIFAVMSFTVSRRTREIGVRVALGADARQVVTGIFRKPLAQVGLGVLVGTFLVAGMLTSELFGRPPGLREVGLITVYAALMMGVCMLSCIVPTRRALRIEPTEALRADG